MSTVRVPTNVSSITFAQSGTLIPDATGAVTGENDAELTGIDAGAKLISSDINTGALTIAVPAAVTGLTINGVAYTCTGGSDPFGNLLNAPVPALDGTLFLQQNFKCVVG